MCPTQPITHAAPNAPNVYFEDFSAGARNLRRVLIGLLVFMLLVGWSMLTSLRTDGADQEVVVAFGILLAILAVGVEALIGRFRRNPAVIAVGSGGVSFPANNVGPVVWDDVTRVRVVQATLRGGARFTYLRFHFRPGVVQKRQFGALRKDKWEIMIASGSFLMGETGRILGGNDRLMEDVAQYHPIENL